MQVETIECVKSYKLTHKILISWLLQDVCVLKIFSKRLDLSRLFNFWLSNNFHVWAVYKRIIEKDISWRNGSLLIFLSFNISKHFLIDVFNNDLLLHIADSLVFFITMRKSEEHRCHCFNIFLVIWPVFRRLNPSLWFIFLSNSSIFRWVVGR